MQHTLRVVGALALSMAAAAAHAEPIIAYVGSNVVSLIPGATGALTLTGSGLDLLNVTSAQVVPGSEGVTVTTSLKAGSSNQIGMARVEGLALTSVMFESSDGLILQEQFSGAFKFTTPVGFLSDTGGSLTISDLRIDFTTGTVLANVWGDNGVGSQPNVALWASPGSILGPSVLGNFVPTLQDGPQPQAGPLAYLYMNNIVATAPNLAFTAQGAAIWATSMGYTTDGRAALGGLKNLAALSTPAVPEPGTMSMMALGLIVVGLTGRRQRAIRIRN
jgi:hypothetical protein